MRSRVREMADLLTAFPLHRQAAIVRRLVCRPAWERGDVPGIGRYGSAENFRVVIAAGVTKPPRFILDPDESPGTSKKTSRQRLYDVPAEYFGPVCGLWPALWAIDRSRSCLGVDPWLNMSRSQSDVECRLRSNSQSVVPSPDPTECRWPVPNESALGDVENDWWRRHPNAPELRWSRREDVEPWVLDGS